MAGLQETIAALLKGRQPPALAKGIRASGTPGDLLANGLQKLKDFGTNPGNLDGFAHVPSGLTPNAPLVVLLHGCLQDAARYDSLTQWSALADAEKFALLLPQQSRSNNQNACFNWFEPGDIGRDRGEAFSIKQMIETMLVRHALDSACVYISGFSAGGAMTCAMLAAYPETFAGGAILAGLPYGCATSVNEALGAMAAAPDRSQQTWGDAVRAAAPKPHRWPCVAIWHGTEDRTVSPGNAAALTRQWQDVHGLSEADAILEAGAHYQRKSWRNGDGRIVLDTFIVKGMGHAIAVDEPVTASKTWKQTYAAAVGISATRTIAQSWGLLEQDRETRATRSEAKPSSTPILDHLRGLVLRKRDGEVSPIHRMRLDEDRSGEGWRAGEWRVEALQPFASEKNPVLIGRASSRLDVDPALGRRVITRRMIVPGARTLTYERKLDLHAGINLFTSATFIVSVDGIEVDCETIVCGNSSDETWVRKHVALKTIPADAFSLTFEVRAFSNVFVEASATAIIRNITMTSQDMPSAHALDTALP